MKDEGWDEYILMLLRVYMEIQETKEEELIWIGCGRV